MKVIEHNPVSLILKDSACHIWMLGLFILAIAGATLAGLIDAYINDNKINEYGTLLVMVFSFTGLAIGGCIIYDHPLVYARFNKNSKKASVHRIGILKSELKTCSLNDIENIEITESEGSEENFFYGLAIKIKNNDRIPLNASCCDTPRNYQQPAAQIKEWLLE